MTAEIVSLAGHRAPVVYSVVLTEGWDGSFSIDVGDVQDDPRSRAAVADSLSRASMLIKTRLRGELD